MKENRLFKFTPFILVLATGILLCHQPMKIYSQQEPAKSVQEKEKPKKPEYQVKASLLRTCANFCYWPPHSNINDLKSDFIIGVFEENEMTDFLQERIITQPVAGKKAKILNISNDEDIKKCNMIYITDVSERRLREILLILDNLPILTLSENKDNVKAGIMINIFPLERGIAYNVNRSVARKNGIDFSSKLLKFAAEIL